MARPTSTSGEKPTSPAEFPQLPTPPWAKEPREGRKAKSPARSPLSRDAIVDAAMHVLDTEGYEAVSMRRVAAELGTGAASLYAHVQDKEELLSLLIDRVSGEYEYPEPDPERWQEQLKDCVRWQRRVFQAHPGIARAFLGRIPLGPNGLRAIEGFLSVASAGNLPDHAVGWAGDAISLYVTAQVFEEDIQNSGTPQGAGEKEIGGWVEEMKNYIKALPADEFPNLIAKVDALFEHGGPDGRFEFGLDLMIRGLATYSGTDDPGPPYESPEPAIVKRDRAD
jgi:AcrR family transcriptional regulator